MTETYRVEISKNKTTTAKVDGPAADGRARGLVFLAHGAANDLDHSLLAETAAALSRRGWRAVRFNFLYREAGRDTLDKNEALIACYSRVIEDALEKWPPQGRPVILGGKSLGARTASMIAGQGAPASAMLFLGYPLHPPGKPELGRENLLEAIGSLPQLFFVGTRDHLCPVDRLKKMAAELPGPTEILVIEGGDHSFVPPKGAGLSVEEITARISASAGDWLDRVFPAE